MKSVLSKRNPAESVQTLVLLTAMVLLAACGAWSQAEKSEDAKARSGWLYVLDTQKHGTASRVLLVDPVRGKVVRSIRVGASPDMVLAPDGRFLYVTSEIYDVENHTMEPRLQVFDNTGSLVASVANPDAVGSTGAEYPSRMAISPSGNWLYVVKMHVAGFVDVYLTVFNTMTRQFIPSRVTLRGCGNTVLLPSHEDLKLSVICAGSSLVRDITMGDSEESSKTNAIPVIPGQETRRIIWNLVFSHQDDDELGLMTANGARYTVYRQTSKSEYVAPAPAPGPGTPARVNAGLQNGAVSQDGTSVFFGDEGTPHTYSSRFDQIVKADTETMTQQKVIPTTIPFFSFALSRDGKTAFTASPDKSTVTVIDMASGKTVRQFKAGLTPMRIIPVP